MTEQTSLPQDELAMQEIENASKVLAKYNLGICFPHMHNESNGNILPLPSGIVSKERDLQVSFQAVSHVAQDGIPVAWRWDGTRLEVCGCCCTIQT
jgi:hypothetical protein